MSLTVPAVAVAAALVTAVAFLVVVVTVVLLAVLERYVPDGGPLRELVHRRVARREAASIEEEYRALVSAR